MCLVCRLDMPSGGLRTTPEVLPSTIESVREPTVCNE